MTTEPRTIGLFDGREITVMYGHHTHPDRDEPINVTDVDPQPPAGTIVVGRLDQAPAKLSDDAPTSGPRTIKCAIINAAAVLSAAL